ncbi:MAG: replicative DNA helicase [Patescibacteria group bacterium]
MADPTQRIDTVRMPPQSLEAEAALLGSLLIDKEAFWRVVDYLEAKDFYKATHRMVYEAMLELVARHEALDILSVTNRLKEKNQLEEIGGTGYLTSLVNTVPTASNAGYYAKLVHRKRIHRDLIEASHRIAELGYKEEENLENVLDDAEKTIFAVAQSSLAQEFLPVRRSLEEAWQRLEKLHAGGGALRGVSTGFPDLDNLLAGLQRSDLIVLASRPSLGKTSLALDIARNVALKENLPVGFFSIEMSQEQVVDRLIASQAGVDLWRLRTGRLSDKGDDNDFVRIRDAMETLSQTPLYIDDVASPTVMQIRAMARRLQAEHGELGLVVVDYLQLIRGHENAENRVQEVSEISRSLKALAKELVVPVLAISQLSRAVEMRPMARPKLSDLRESGCLAGDTFIMRADTGELVPLRDLVGKSDIPVYSLGDDWQLRVSRISKVFSSGRKQLFELHTRSGRIIKASANHPFRTLGEWRRLDELAVGMQIATTRHLSPAEPVARLSGIETAYCGSTLCMAGLSRERMGRVATAVASEPLMQRAASDVYWDEVVSITPLGIEEVFDATVPGVHNFIANDIVVHNSIEQDADVVMFIYREDKVKENTEKKNIAEILIEKHRNGPTGKAVLFFHEETASFRSIAKHFEEGES